MKKIAVFTDTKHEQGTPVFTPEYLTCYLELSQALNKQGGQLYVTRDQKSYLGNGHFSQSWIITETGLIETGPIVADVIFNKGRLETNDDIPVLNCRKIKETCDNKWLTYQKFSEYCPKTFFVTTIDELHAILDQITTPYTVFKPYLGAEGIGVKIKEKQYFTQSSTSLLFPGVVSEFLDTSGGIQDIVDGIHDLRLAIFDGEVLFSYVRTPPKGSLLANVAQGGTLHMVDLKRLPQELFTIARNIDLEFSECGHRFYSIDFGYTTDGPKIIEMNSEVGLSPISDDPIFAILYEKLAKAFMDM